MTEKLDPETKRLRKLSDGELADEVGTLEARHDVLKAEAIRRELKPPAQHDRGARGTMFCESFLPQRTPMPRRWSRSSPARTPI